MADVLIAARIVIPFGPKVCKVEKKDSAFKDTDSNFMIAVELDILHKKNLKINMILRFFFNI